jgi:hypothetical protein
VACVTFRGTTRRLLILTSLLLLCWCPTALAAFPGADGQLAVQPVTGGGIVLERPDGTHVTRICTVRSLCGSPAAPSFAPNGRGLVFRDARTGQIEIVAPDGACLWCLQGRKLTAALGSDPAFGSSATVTAIARGGVLTRFSLTGAKPARVATGDAVTAAVSSSRRGLAVVRGAWIYARPGRTGRLVKLVRGSAPDWSPTGRDLVYARAAAIWTVRVPATVSSGVLGHKRRPVAKPPAPRRLASGGDPVWSPAGARIAYLAPGGRVEVIATNSAHRHAVGSVRGRAVAWQPRPTRLVPCAKGKGKVVTQSSTSVLREAKVPGQWVNWNGCLRLLGTARHLTGGSLDSDLSTTLTASGVGGRFTALGVGTFDHYGNCGNSLNLFDNATARQVFSWQATSDGGCDPISAVVTDASGFAAWKVSMAPLSPNGLNAVSCPSVDLCVTIDNQGNVLTSTDPAHGAWTITASPPGIAAVGVLSCPTTSFCAGTTQTGVYTSTNPTGGSAAWTFTPLTSPVPGQLSWLGQVSCASASFCALTFDVVAPPTQQSGEVLVSTNPTGGRGAWTASYSSPQPIDDLSCPSTSLCVATDANGDVITSTDPTDTQPTWSSASLGLEESSLTCRSNTLCLISNHSFDDTSDVIYASTNPTAGAGAWAPVLTGTDLILTQPSCAPASVCVVLGTDSIYTSTNPASPGSWLATTLTAIGPTRPSCPTANLCVIATDDGQALVSANPAAGGPTYAAQRIDGPPCFVAGTACITESLFVHDDAGTRLIDSAPLGNGHTIGNVRLRGNSTRLTWTHAGQPHALTLH